MATCRTGRRRDSRRWQTPTSPRSQAMMAAAWCGINGPAHGCGCRRARAFALFLHSCLGVSVKPASVAKTNAKHRTHPPPATRPTHQDRCWHSVALAVCTIGTRMLALVAFEKSVTLALGRQRTSVRCDVPATLRDAVFDRLCAHRSSPLARARRVKESASLSRAEAACERPDLLFLRAARPWFSAPS